MPIYEYKCNGCGTVSEILHKSMDTKTVNCSKCDSTDLSKLVSVPGAVMTKERNSVPTDVPPACPNQDRCGVSSCPASNFK